MIIPSPSEEVLRSAHLITLFDPQIPEWSQTVCDRVVWGRLSGIKWIVVDIPVDSRNPDSIGFWMDRVKQTRPESG